MITTPGFACGDTVYSTNVKIVNSADWDNDGIPDANDITMITMVFLITRREKMLTLTVTGYQTQKI